MSSTASIAGWYFYLSAPRPPLPHLQPHLYTSVSLSRRLYRHLIFSAYKLTLKIFYVCRASESIVAHTYVQDSAFRATEHACNASLSLSAPLWREFVQSRYKLLPRQETSQRASDRLLRRFTYCFECRTLLTGHQLACIRSSYRWHINCHLKRKRRTEALVSS